MNLLGKWLDEVKKEKAEEFKKSEGSAQIYNSLIDFTQSLKGEIVIKKLQLIFSDYKDKYDSEVNIETVLLARKNPKVATQVGKIVLLLSSILKKIKQIKSVEKVFVDQKKVTCYEMQERIYKILLFYYKAQYFGAKNQLRDGYFICQSLADDLKKAEEYYKANLTVLSENKDKFLDEALNIGKKLKRLKCLIHCSFMIKENAKEGRKVGQKETKAKRAIKYKDAVKLIKDDAANNVKLTSWVTDIATAPKDLFAPKKKEVLYPENADCITLQDNPKKIKIFDLLSHMKQLHVKPFLHDVAGSMIEFPDIDAAIKEAKEKQGGLLKKIKWLFGR